MSEPVVNAAPSQPEDVATPPTEPAAKPAKPSLEDSLAGLDEHTRSFVLGELQSARNEAKNLRQRVKDAEPIVAQFRALEEASKSELERAQEAARVADERARATVQRVAVAELKAALTGVVPDPAAVIEDLNMARFLNDEGDVNADAVSALRQKYAALAPVPQPRMQPNPAQGTSAHPPLSLAERIAQAEQAGDLKTALRLKASQAMTPGGSQ